jgi:nucleotide-binding universal stress UspA family protein
MTYRTILVQLDLDAPASPRLNFAIDLARRFEASVIGFAAAEAHVYVPHDESGMVASELLKRQTVEIEERLAALKEEFLGVVGEQEHLSWRGLVGNPTELLAANARAADLVVTGMAAGGASSDRRRTVDPGSLVLAAGRPVFIASETLAPVRAETVVVAWKDAREARRAVLDAIPFLVGAKEVLVVTIEEGEQKAARERAADVVRFLMRHGARARADVLGIGDSDVGDAVSQIARETGADLIVAGGYGHSRFREWAFGGMTRSLLADGSVHRLISN